jgi:hypothetical protein
LIMSTDDDAERYETIEVAIPLDSPACTVCGDITVDLDGNARPCVKHPAAPLAPRGGGN